MAIFVLNINNCNVT